MQRVTRQRVTIINFLAKQKEFLSAQTIHDTLKAEGETIGLATIYRTLQSLAESEQIDSLRSPEGETLYRKCILNAHYHLMCKTCGKIVEISGNSIKNWINKIAKEYDFSHIELMGELFGVCAECMKLNDN